ncbi:MAG: hypothetical protein LAO22_08365 [Acidobacteriia bacterium]|nr:hypothetical protein [Terriglobia bacterium]
MFIEILKRVGVVLEVIGIALGAITVMILWLIFWIAPDPVATTVRMWRSFIETMIPRMRN